MRRKCQLTLPINLEKIIATDDEVFTLEEICEELDFSALERKFRKSIYNPITMFKIIVYAYMCGVYSSREIEKACRRDINFMWLLDDMPVPDHNTIARFRKAIFEETKELFYQLVALLHEKKEIGFTNVFIDGTKIEANANKYTFVWKENTKRYNVQNEEKIADFIIDYNQRYKKNLKKIETVKNHLEKDIEKYDIVLVSGKGKHKTQLQRDYEKVNELLKSREKYAEQFLTFAGRSNYSKTDTDATFMHMKEDHMKNGQLKPGYNIQIAVDSEYIVNTGTFSNRADTLTLIPFLKDTNEKVHKYKEIVADAGYESEENYVFLNKEGQISFIKPLNYEQLKKKQSKYHHSNFQYIVEKDIFICPEGNEMTFEYLKNVKSASGYVSEKKVFKTDQCLNCPNRENCTTAKDGRRNIEYSPLLEKYRKTSLANITSKHGTELRVNRSIQVEGAFGVLKQDYHFRRFLTRGKENVSTEMLLLCFAYDVNKYNHKQRDKRTQTYLFKLDAA